KWHPGSGFFFGLGAALCFLGAAIDGPAKILVIPALFLFMVGIVAGKGQDPNLTHPLYRKNIDALKTRFESIPPERRKYWETRFSGLVYSDYISREAAIKDLEVVAVSGDEDLAAFVHALALAENSAANVK